MNKLGLIEKLSIETGLPMKKSSQFLNQLLECLVQELVQGESVRIVGFGTFKVRHRKPRTGYLPISKQPVLIPEGRVVSFAASEKLKRRLISAEKV